MPQARRRISPARSACRRLNLLLWLALLPGAATAATFRPGERADPPTGDLAAGTPSAAEPLREGGFEWVFAPPRVNGVVGLDVRALRLDDGSTTTQAVQTGEAEWATYLWQPWFAQVRFGLGYVASRDLSSGASGADQGGQGTSLTGRFSTQLFPASRFPFELRADLSDSRASGDSLLGDLRSQRLSVSQSYRPETGNDSYQFQLDHSRVDTASGGDTLLSVQGTAVHLTVDHRFELGANLSDHERQDTGDTTRVQSVTVRHGYHPERHLDIETLASWNDVQLRSGVPGGLDFGIDVRQVSTLVTWRPGRDEVAETADDGAEPDPSAPPPPPPSSLLVAGSARWMESRAGMPGGLGAVQGVNASVGVSQDLSRDWRASAALSVNALRGSGLAEGRGVLANGTLTWSPMGGAWGDWRYSPSGAATLSAGTDSGLGRRAQAGLQGSHSLSRDLSLAGGVVSISLAQSAGALHETLERRTSSALAHSIGLSWQVQGEGGRQSLAGLSLSDSRTWSDGSGSFQFVNLQLSQRQQLSRYSQWSANLTAQAFRNRSTEIDVFTGERRLLETGWQPYYSGSLNLEQARLWGVPRLRHTLLLGFSSQQLESRAFGDIDAPRQHISESFESRLDYSIGRLEARLSARAARIDGRWVAALVARLQRHF